MFLCYDELVLQNARLHYNSKSNYATSYIIIKRAFSLCSRSTFEK